MVAILLGSTTENSAGTTPLRFSAEPTDFFIHPTSGEIIATDSDQNSIVTNQFVGIQRFTNQKRINTIISWDVSADIRCFSNSK